MRAQHGGDLSPSFHPVRWIFRENPVFRLLLGLCPALGATSTAMNGFAMGAATAFVLLCTNATFSLVKRLVPRTVGIAVFLVIAAAYVSIADMTLKAFAPSIHRALGIFIPLIVVNCLILVGGGAPASACSGGGAPRAFSPSLADAFGMGLGFLLSLVLIGAVRQIGSAYLPVFGMPPGAFLTLGLLLAAAGRSRNGKNEPSGKR